MSFYGVATTIALWTLLLRCFNVCSLDVWTIGIGYAIVVALYNFHQNTKDFRARRMSRSNFFMWVD